MLFSFSFLLAPLLLGAASRVQAVPPANLSSSALLFSDALQQSPLSFPPPSSHLRNLPDLNDASIEELQDGLRSSLFTSEELILVRSIGLDGVNREEIKLTSCSLPPSSPNPSRPTGREPTPSLSYTPSSSSILMQWNKHGIEILCAREQGRKEDQRRSTWERYGDCQF